jgi:hypothetical protein
MQNQNEQILKMYESITINEYFNIISLKITNKTDYKLACIIYS